MAKKTLPDLTTDAAAEAFVETADLAEYDLTSMVPMRFELRRKDKALSLRLPEALLDEVRAKAKQAGIPTQRFIRLAIEGAVRGRGPETRRP